MANIHLKYVFLDDYRLPRDAYTYTNNPIYLQDNWIIIRNYEYFVKFTLENGIVAGYSFDHDLADTHYKNQTPDYTDETLEKTGYHCAKWLIDYCIDNKKEIPAEIYIHSMNPAGSMNIKSLFDTYMKVFGERLYIYILPSSRR